MLLEFFILFRYITRHSYIIFLILPSSLNLVKKVDVFFSLAYFNCVLSHSGTSVEMWQNGKPSS